jgi:SAM-dependent methyltransferase
LKRLIYLTKIWLKSIRGWLYCLALPLIVPPPRTAYKGNYFTVHRHHVIKLLEQWKGRLHGKVLDVGVGTWEYPRQMLQAVCEYTSTDCFEHPNIDVVCDIQKLSAAFAPNSFDFVICTEVLEHIPRPWLAVQQLYTVLKPGGVLLLTTPFNFHLHGNEGFSDYWRISADGLRLLLIEEAHFSKVEITPFGHPEYPFSHTAIAYK